jgi:3-deoxy-D-manno-octulosonic-acid transferase
MWLLYDLIIHLYGDAISVASLFNAKAKQWVVGRKNLFHRIESLVVSRESLVSGQQTDKNFRLSTNDYRLTNTAWFHCASLGEFEQGRPVIEAFRTAHPRWKIVLTFFSPSGYEVRKNFEGADHIFYLPLDTPVNAKKFIRLVQPSIVIFVKYEFWFRYLDVLYRKKIPVYVISAIFRPDQHFFKWYGTWARKQLKKVTHFFVQDEASEILLRGKGIVQVTVSGDTRFDRVAAIAENTKSFPLVEKFVSDHMVFLAGSTWPADEELIIKLIEEHGDRMKFIIAPHEVHPARIEALKSAVVSRQSLVVSQASGHKVLTFSELNYGTAESAMVLIVDGIGYLSHLYQYATIAYIGGGFGAGIHNILEAATFGKPVIFGPKYKKFREAVDLIETGGAFSIQNAEQLNNRTIELLEDENFRKESSLVCSSYVSRKKGATGIILSSIHT